MSSGSEDETQQLSNERQDREEQSEEHNSASERENQDDDRNAQTGSEAEDNKKNEEKSPEPEKQSTPAKKETKPVKEARAESETGSRRARRRRNRPSWMESDKENVQDKQMAVRQQQQRQQQQQQQYQRQQMQMQQQQQQMQPQKDDNKESLKLRLDLNLEVEVTLKARIHGDLTLSLLYVSLIFQIQALLAVRIFELTSKLTVSEATLRKETREQSIASNDTKGLHKLLTNKVDDKPERTEPRRHWCLSFALLHNVWFGHMDFLISAMITLCLELALVGLKLRGKKSLAGIGIT